MAEDAAKTEKEEKKPESVLAELVRMRQVGPGSGSRLGVPVGKSRVDVLEWLIKHALIRLPSGTESTPAALIKVGQFFFGPVGTVSETTIVSYHTVQGYEIHECLSFDLRARTVDAFEQVEKWFADSGEVRLVGPDCVSSSTFKQLLVCHEKIGIWIKVVWEKNPPQDPGVVHGDGILAPFELEGQAATEPDEASDRPPPPKPRRVRRTSFVL